MKARELTTEERKILSPYEEYMRSAAEHGWMRWPGLAAVKQALSVWEAAYNATYKLNTGCGACVKNLFVDLWHLYNIPAPAKARRARK